MENKSRVYVGVNFGMEAPTVMLAARYTPAPDDYLHIFRELYEPGFYFDELLPIAKAWAKELNVRKFFVDPDEPEFIKRMRRQRLYAVPGLKEMGLARSIMKARLNNFTNGLPGGISVAKECPKTIPEFFKFRGPERDPRRPFRDKPLDMDNYGIGALHFLVLGLANEVTPRVRWL